MRLTEMKIIYSMYRADEVSVHRACCERATQHYSLGEEASIYPGSRPAGVTARYPRMVTECLRTRSMLIRMYYRFMVCACTCTIVFTVSCLKKYLVDECLTSLPMQRTLHVTSTARFLSKGISILYDFAT